MKKSLILVALLLLLGAGAFAAAPAKIKGHDSGMPDRVSLIPLRLESGFAVMVEKRQPGRSVVILYDNDQNVVFKDVLSKGTTNEKKYNLAYLSNGHYTLEVYSTNHDIKRQFDVYNRGEKKIVHLM